MDNKNQAGNHLAERDFSPRYGSEDRIDLIELMAVLWKGKYLIVGTTFFAAVVSIIVALSLPNIYRTEALLASGEESGGGLAALASQYSGLASFAGVSLPTSSKSGDVQVGIAKLRSREFIVNFIEKHDILPELMAAESFSWRTNQLSYDESIFDPSAKIWIRQAKLPLESKPSSQEAYKAFSKIFTVEQNSDNGFVTISIEHLSPYIAEQWVTWLVEGINEEMRVAAIDQSKQSIDFLTDQLKSTEIIDLEQVFYSLIEEQTKTIMLANARPEYLFVTIDPAVVPEEKAGPFRALICVLGTTIGAIAGIFLSLLWQFNIFYKSRPSES